MHASRSLHCVSSVTQTYIAPEMSLFGPALPGSPELFANMRVYGLIVLAVVAIPAYIGERHVCVRRRGISFFKIDWTG